jgi:mannose-6-phosphate isomerase-like protein (cupin superfamily)
LRYRLQRAEPGAGAPLHAHKDADEVFIVLEGTLDFRSATSTSW